MRKATNPLFNREDTFFGVCEGLGEDLHVSPNLFRLGFAALLFWNPAAAIGTYFALGVLVYAVRWMLPDYYPATSEVDASAADAAGNDAEAVSLQQAA